MKTSWNRCLEFAAAAQEYLSQREGKPETKLTYALNRVGKRLARQQAKMDEKLGDIEIDNCVTETRNGEDVIVRDGQGSLQYTKDGIKKRNAARTALMSADEIEVEPHFATKLPDDLNFVQIEAFAGFVIPEADAERMLVDLEAGLNEPAAAAASA